MFHIPPYPAMDDPMLKVCQPLSAEQITGLRDLGDEYLRTHPQPGKVGFHEHSAQHGELRECVTTWLPWPEADKRTRWIYEMAGDVVQQANAVAWQFDIWGFYDQLHYVRYDGASGGHFAWHQDKGDDWRRPQRKLAIVVLLSDPSEYEGGQFQIFDGSETTVKATAQGAVLIFPSFVQHRVLPVTKGERRSLIGWLCGQKFR